jgi:hypothetical protein
MICKRIQRRTGTPAVTFLCWAPFVGLSGDRAKASEVYVFRCSGTHGSGGVLRKDTAAGLEWLQLEGDGK